MRIAVAYENGEVFQHFGHSEEFKIYEVEDGHILSSETISSNGSGHGALASLLGDQKIDVVICGGIAAAHRPPWQREASSSAPALPATPMKLLQHICAAS